MADGSTINGYTEGQQDQPEWQEPPALVYSHHGTPAQEFMAASWTPDHMHYGSSSTILPNLSNITHGQSPIHLHPAQAFPQWPSQISPEMSDPQKPLPLHFQPRSPSSQEVSETVHATPKTSTASQTQRRTLTNGDRFRMCKFAAANPGMKQTEIGSVFNVDRSTVSKVLRHKEKYREPSNTTPPLKKNKMRKAEVERALSKWVESQKQSDVEITEEALQTQATVFALALGATDDDDSAISDKWLEKFKVRHGLVFPQRVIDQPAQANVTIYGDVDGARSPDTALSPAVAGLRMGKSDEDLGRPLVGSIGQPPPDERLNQVVTSAAHLQQANGYMTSYLHIPSQVGNSSGLMRQTSLVQGNPEQYMPASLYLDERQRRSTYPQEHMIPHAVLSLDQGAQKTLQEQQMYDSPMNPFPQPHDASLDQMYDYKYLLPSGADASYMDALEAKPAVKKPSLSRLKAKRTQSYSSAIGKDKGGDSVSATPSREEARNALNIAKRYLHAQPDFMKEHAVLEKVINRLDDAPPRSMAG